jgi:hypothetical protein
MKLVLIATLAALVVVGAAPQALADNPCDPCQPVKRQWVERTIEIPAVMRTVRKPIFECIDVPIYRNKCTPTYREIQVPVYKTRNIPVYRTARTPRFKDVEIPVYATRSIPVYKMRKVPQFETVQVPVFRTRQIPLTKEVCDPCGVTKTVTCGYRSERVQCGTRPVTKPAGCIEERVQCGCRSERYQCGTRTVRQPDGCDEKQVECGARCETYQDGTETRRIRCGTDVERIQCGSRQVKRFKEWQCETVEVCPARTRTIRECITVPCN